MPDGDSLLRAGVGHSDATRCAESVTTANERAINEITGFFEGLELVEPGVVPNPLWRPDEPDSQPLSVYCGVARKP